MDYKIAAKNLNTSIELNKIYKTYELLNILQSSFNFGKSYTSGIVSEMKKDHTIYKEGNGYKFNKLPIYYGKIEKWHKSVAKIYSRHSIEDIINKMSYKKLVKLQSLILNRMVEYTDILKESKRALLSLGFTPDEINIFLKGNTSF